MLSKSMTMLSSMLDMVATVGEPRFIMSVAMIFKVKFCFDSIMKCLKINTVSKHEVGRLPI